MKQKEQSSRVQSEQTTSRLERLRSKIVQAVYTAPGAIRPESRLEDEEILNAIQKVQKLHFQFCKTKISNLKCKLEWSNCSILSWFIKSKLLWDKNLKRHVQELTVHYYFDNFDSRLLKVRFPSRSNQTVSPTLATAATFFQSCVGQTLSRGCGPRHSSHASL